jgi:hypothetical protein
LLEPPAHGAAVEREDLGKLPYRFLKVNSMEGHGRLLSRSAAGYRA